MHLNKSLSVVSQHQIKMANFADDCIQALSRVLETSFHALLESKQPAKQLLGDEDVAGHISRRILQPASGKANDELCQWLYDTYQTQDAQLQLVVLRFVPLVCGEYLRRVTTTPHQPLAGFEAVLLALYGAETRARGGKPTMINVPRLGHATPFHAPSSTDQLDAPQHLHVAIASPALEPQSTAKSTKRADVVGVALDLFCKRISSMPSTAKLDLCRYARSWAVKGCSWSKEVETIAKSATASVPSSLNQFGAAALTDGEALESPDPPHLTRSVQGPGKWDVAEPSLTNSLAQTDREEARELDHHDDGRRVCLEMPEILRPILKALGHCLMAPSTTPVLRSAATDAARALYAWASQALVPEAVMASRSLVRLSAPCSSPSAKVHRAEILVRQARRES